jgi:hypothetical protein
MSEMAYGVSILEGVDDGIFLLLPLRSQRCEDSAQEGLANRFSISSILTADLLLDRERIAELVRDEVSAA